ncbi:MAG: sigma-70 family RNA polymerase sigma factor [Rhodobacterales bacterium]|nr:sigma-70 family RNA polymerase sigma factor [Rhodobacterales bacterium]
MSTLTLLKPIRALDDFEIKALGREDPRAAADLIIRKYRDALFHHAANILKDYHRAADVTQEVFIRAMREKRFYTPEFKMKAWLYRVTTNLCFNMVRNRKRRAAILEARPPKRSTDAAQVDTVFRTEQHRTIMQAMDGLTESHRRILMLRYYSDLSYAEIADTLDIKLGTVMSRLSRAKRRLVEALEQVEGSEEVQGV